jgi:hypothetical protein
VARQQLEVTLRRVAVVLGETSRREAEEDLEASSRQEVEVDLVVTLRREAEVDSDVEVVKSVDSGEEAAMPEVTLVEAAMLEVSLVVEENLEATLVEGRTSEASHTEDPILDRTVEEAVTWEEHFSARKVSARKPPHNPDRLHLDHEAPFRRPHRPLGADQIPRQEIHPHSQEPTQSLIFQLVPKPVAVQPTQR